RTLAVTADSESQAEEQRGMAREIAERFSLRHRFVRTEELANPAYARNDRDRCYFCKSELFAHLVPLAEAGLTKADIRLLSRERGLPTWDLPASPCLASRLPYGTTVTLEAMRQVEAAESALRGLGFRELRVRHLGDTGRVEIAADELARLSDPDVRAAVEAAVRGAGYARVAIDPAGYRRGNLNLVVLPAGASR